MTCMERWLTTDNLILSAAVVLHSLPICGNHGQSFLKGKKSLHIEFFVSDEGDEENQGY